MIVGVFCENEKGRRHVKIGEKKRIKYSKTKNKMYLTMAECGLISKKAVNLIHTKEQIEII